LWALRVFPSAARVQSTSVPLSRSVSKFCISVLWWLFHLRQNCWSSSMVILASFPRFCTNDKTSQDDERASKRTNKQKPDNATNVKTYSGGSLVFSLSFSLRLSIGRPTRRYLVLPRLVFIAHIEPDDVPAKVRFLTFDYRSDDSVSPFSSPLFARGPRGRTTEVKSSATKR